MVEIAIRPERWKGRVQTKCNIIENNDNGNCSGIMFIISTYMLRIYTNRHEIQNTHAHNPKKIMRNEKQIVNVQINIHMNNHSYVKVCTKRVLSNPFDDFVIEGYNIDE